MMEPLMNDGPSDESTAIEEHVQPTHLKQIGRHALEWTAGQGLGSFCRLDRRVCHFSHRSMSRVMSLVKSGQ